MTMLPDDAHWLRMRNKRKRATYCRPQAGRTGHFPAPPRLPGPRQPVLHKAPQPRLICRFGGNTAAETAARHIRRTHRRHHWRLAHRLSPTITDSMVLNWCSPGETTARNDLRASSPHALKALMIKLVAVRQGFAAMRNTQSVLMVDAALLRVAALLRAAKTI